MGGKHPADILIRPILTEKAVRLNEDYGKLVFEVHIKATKPEIKKAVEMVFGVKVKKVNTMIVKPKRKRVLTRRGRLYGKTRRWKKAIITLEKGQKIDLTSIEL
ncbi:MAG: 50S ribosomal protein L23 [Gammaproteobacteria bacterium]|nr:MAG: 50S ribosomal protein L23 [Gammaproteobacteria bacterium]